MNRLSVIYKFWAILFILFVSACGSQGTQTTGKNGNTATVTIGLHRVLASVSGDAGDLAAVASITLTVSAPDMATITASLPLNGDTLSLDVPAGVNRVFTASARDTGGSVTHTGNTTVAQLVAGGRTNVSITLNPVILDTTPPAVTSTSPEDGATDVATNTAIVVYFSEAMNASTLTAGTTFTLRDGTNTVNGSVSYDAGTFSATFTPLSDISPNTTYTATITTGIQDLAGNGLAADQVWTFTTAALPPADTTPPSAVFPWDGQTGLSPNIVFPVFFSEPMNTATITTETFTLSDGTSLVDGFVSYGWYYPGIDVAEFVAPSFLLLNTTYTGTITTGAQDLAGNGLAADYVFTFTTLGVPPTFAGIAIAVPSSPTSVDLAWSAATDDVSPSDQIVYDISLLTPPGDPVNTSYTSDPGATSFTISGLTEGADYYIRVQARDEVGNQDDNNASAYVRAPIPYFGPYGTNYNLQGTPTAGVPGGVSFSYYDETCGDFTLDFGDGTSDFQSCPGDGGQVTVDHVYQSPGTYTVTLSEPVYDVGQVQSLTLTTAVAAVATDTTSPTVVTTNPADGATDVAVNTMLSVTFSEAMNAATLTAGTTFTLSDGASAVDGSVSYGAGTNTATFTPLSDLEPGTVYTATITTGVQDLSGNSLAADMVWTFTTADSVPPSVTSTSPVDGATDVSMNMAIAVHFSEAMNAATLTAGTTFRLNDGASSVAGSVSYNGGTNTAIFRPSSSLLPGTTYTATITTGAQDLAGNALAAELVWTFTTAVSWSGSIQMGGSGTDISRGITVDGSGNIYVTGGLDDGYGVFVVKYDASGVKQWIQRLPHLGYTVIPYGVSVDGSGNVYVAGYTSGDFDGNTSAGLSDLFVVKYNASGVKQWTRQFGTTASDVAFSVSADGSGNVYVAGSTGGDLDGNTSAGLGDLFMVKYDTSGVKQWTQQLGTTANDAASGVSVDGSGNVYVAGTTNGGLDGNTNSGNSDPFVVKYDASGVKQWTRQLGTTGYDGAYGVSADGSGNVYVTGYVYGSLDGNTWSGDYDTFVVKYDASGVKQWTRQLGTPVSEYFYGGISVDVCGDVYAAGSTNGDLDGNTNAGGSDIFIVKYNASGVKQWTRQLGATETDVAYGVSVDGCSNVYVTGDTMGDLDGNTNAGGWDVFIVKYNASGVKQ